MKMINFLFIFMFVFVSLFTTSCSWFQGDDSQKESPPEIKEVKDEISIKNDPKSSFERFRRAAKKAQWSEAYNEFTKQWKANLSVSSFVQEMQGVDRSMFEEPILSIYYAHEEDEPECHIITQDPEGGKTIYQFLMEDNIWKMGGIKFVAQETPEKQTKESP